MAAETQARILLDPKPILRILGLLTLLGIAYLIREMVFLFLFTLVFAAAIYPAVQWIARGKIPIQLAILLFYLLLFGLVGTALYFAGDLMIEQTRQFLLGLPGYIDSALDFIGQRLYLPVDTNLAQIFQQQLQQFSSQIFRFLVSAVDYVVLMISVLAGVVIVLALTFYLLSDVQYFKKVVVDAMPRRHQAETAKILEQGADKIGDYIRGMLGVMFIDGVLAWIGLSIIGVPYAFLLGALTFMLNIIPLIGSTLAGALVVLIALGYEPIMGLWALLLYLAIQMLENYVLTPNILGRSIQLNPLWVLVSVLTAGSLFGLGGVLLAVPGAVILKILIHEFYIAKRQDPDPPAGGSWSQG